MADNNENQDIIGDLHGDENNVEEAMGHDPKNAEAQAVDAVDKAGDATATGKKRKMKGGTAVDSGKQDPMQKLATTDPSAKMRDAGAQPTEGVRLTKAGMINDVYQMMNDMTSEEIARVRSALMSEESSEEVESNEKDFDYEGNWKEDLDALVNNEATLSEEFRSKAETIFNSAIQVKLSEEIDRLEEKYETELAEAVEETKTGLVDKVDSYLNYVVENWMEENKLAVQSGLRTEIAEKFMNNLKDLFTESYIDVPESKVDLVDDLADEVEELETTLNDQMAKTIAMQEELEGYKREAILREASRDLAETQIEKLRSLMVNEDFDSEESFAEKVETIKESYFNKKRVMSDETMIDEEDANTSAAPTGSMDQYINALKTQTKK
tara:strand:+ start:78 stop:1223 length:1146 start_codon:yes stop_codon:yes gene_type:complete